MGNWRSASGELSRKDFLKVGGTGLAGAAFLGAGRSSSTLRSRETTPKDAARTLKRELESIIQQGQES
jgi:hypothetical protein